MQAHRDTLRRVMLGELKRVSLEDPVATRLKDAGLIQLRTQSVDEARTVECRVHPDVKGVEAAEPLDAPPVPALYIAARGHN